MKEHEDDNDDRPRKRLKELDWPPEPDPALWEDPLLRDDVKPLRGFEFEAIGQSFRCDPLASHRASYVIHSLPSNRFHRSRSYFSGCTPPVDETRITSCAQSARAITSTSSGSVTSSFTWLTSGSYE